MLLSPINNVYCNFTYVILRYHGTVPLTGFSSYWNITKSALLSIYCCSCTQINHSLLPVILRINPNDTKIVRYLS